MAYTMRQAAQWLKDDAQDGIAWLVLWRDGRGWGWDTVYLEEKTDGAVVLDCGDDMERLRDILQKDPKAIIVNGYTHNLGVLDGHVTRDDLATALRWQYDLQRATLADLFGRVVQVAQ